MQYHDRPASCMNCCEAIAVKDLYHSSAQYGYPLCDSCQQELKPRLRQSSRAATRLYFSLRKMGIKAELEKFDGYKTVDIAVKDARLHIEVEAPQHHYNPFEAMANLQKDCFTFKKGYNTLHVPSALIAYNLESTVSYIADFIRVKQLSRF